MVRWFITQDLEHLLRIDAANIGIELEDRRQRSERLLAKAGDGELRALQKKAGDGAAVATVQDAQALRDKVNNSKCSDGRSKEETACVCVCVCFVLLFWSFLGKQRSRIVLCRSSRRHVRSALSGNYRSSVEK